MQPSVTMSPARVRATASALLVFMLAPLVALPAATSNAWAQTPPKKGMSTGKKLVLLGGAALLYYLYKRHQANKAATPTTSGTPAASKGKAQLYRSKNGGVYYRDPNGKPVWLTVPNKPVQVPYSEVQQYAPNYQSIRGGAPAAPRGYRTQPFSEYDNSAMPAMQSGGGQAGGPPGPGR